MTALLKQTNNSTMDVVFNENVFLLVITDTFNVAFFFFTCQKLCESPSFSVH